jgi:hypothetical protein
MASTFAELYGDYQDTAKVYTEKLDVTPVTFMRQLTRGMQIFQRETEYVERVVVLSKAAGEPFWVVPQDMLRAVELREYINDETRPLIFQSYPQLSRNIEVNRSLHNNVPTTHDLRGTNQAGRGGWTSETKRASIYGREIYMYPGYSGTLIDLYYIPDILAFTQPANPVTAADQWAAWFPIETNFNPLFITARITPSLAPYESAFVDFALASFIKSKGSPNYQIYEQSFYQHIERAKLNKPQYYRQGAADYFLAPYS